MTSCDLLIFLDQPAEAIRSTHLRDGRPQRHPHSRADPTVTARDRVRPVRGHEPRRETSRLDRRVISEEVDRVR